MTDSLLEKEKERYNTMKGSKKEKQRRRKSRDTNTATNERRTLWLLGVLFILDLNTGVKHKHLFVT